MLILEPYRGYVVLWKREKIRVQRKYIIGQ